MEQNGCPIVLLFYQVSIGVSIKKSTTFRNSLVIGKSMPRRLATQISLKKATDDINQFPNPNNPTT